MRIKDLKIQVQLISSFAIMIGFVIVLGIVSYLNANKLHEQTATMYNHPVQVRRAIGNLEVDVLKIRLEYRNLMLATTAQERNASLQQIEIASIDASKNFQLIEEKYLGPKSDVEQAYKAFVLWNTTRQQSLKLIESGQLDKVKESIDDTGEIGILREDMLNKIAVIDSFAKGKGDELSSIANQTITKLNQQLLIIIISLILLSLSIAFFLTNLIRKPILDLTIAAEKFKAGDMTVRDINDAHNEFGILSATFNDMVATIEKNATVENKIANIANVMLSEEDARKFFRTSFSSLCTHTNSQMAAVYLLTDDKKFFEHYESIGMDDSSKIKFSATTYEGEFGQVLSTKKLHFVKKIPIDTRFIFQTVSGKFIPREIITIPILAGNNIVAIISLASVRSYSEEAILIINSILDILNARVEGILAYRTMKNFSEILEAQNTELEAQKKEMDAQTKELSEQNRELEMQKNQLKDANKHKTNFLSNMSHELRTPLNSVIALSGVLSRKLVNKISDDEQNYLEIIERNGKQLLMLINDILDISRVESGRVEMEIVNFNCKELVNEIVEILQPMATAKNVNLVAVHSPQDILLTNDAQKCKHILQNLVGNAIKFTDNGQVEICTEIINNRLNIKVTDTGIGIAEKHLPHIFDEFRQADGSTSRRFGGTGLGLAIAKKFANLLGGTITVTSKPDYGSVFTLSLPLIYDIKNKIEETPKIEEITTSSIIPTKQNSTGKTILLVEDSEPAIIQIKDFLEESGYTILVATNGDLALEIIDKTIPDAMILDLMMPGKDGFEVLKTLRNEEKTAQIPVLILTAKHITKDDLKVLKRNNVHQLIQKGDVQKSELLTAISAMTISESENKTKEPIKNRKIIGKPSILIIEDNPDNLTTLKAILGSEFVIFEAMNALDGIEMTKENNPTLILMDIALPDMDGIEAFKIIRRQFENIPIIAVTASAMINDKEGILAHGFDAYVPKPIDDKDLFKVINEVLFEK